MTKNHQQKWDFFPFHQYERKDYRRILYCRQYPHHSDICCVRGWIFFFSFSTIDADEILSNHIHTNRWWQSLEWIIINHCDELLSWAVLMRRVKIRWWPPQWVHRVHNSLLLMRHSKYCCRWWLSLNFTDVYFNKFVMSPK